MQFIFSDEIESSGHRAIEPLHDETRKSKFEARKEQRISRFQFRVSVFLSMTQWPDGSMDHFPPLQPCPRKARPALAPVSRPRSYSICPFTTTYSIPLESWVGLAYVALSLMAPASKTVISAKKPGFKSPRPRKCSRARREAT